MRLKELRILAGLSQKDLAEKLSLTAHNIGDWEREKAEPSIYWLDKIATVFNCSIDYLVGREDDLGIVQAQIVSPTLTKEETELLLAYKTLSAKGKNLLSELAKRIEISERR